MSLKCTALYLSQYRFTSPHLLATGNGTRTPTIIEDVYVHPSAKVHQSAKIGPIVSVSANAYVGPGARLISCIILDDVEIKENAVVVHSIVGWKSSVGRWSCIQTEGEFNAELGITILGEAVNVEDEVIVINSVVLPNKTLKSQHECSRGNNPLTSLSEISIIGSPVNQIEQSYTPLKLGLDRVMLN